MFLETIVLKKQIVKIYKYILSDQGPPDMPKYVYD